MNIKNRVEKIRELAKTHRRYQMLSEQSGVSYEWLSKFARGVIPNPTVDNVAKLESYFVKNNELFQSCDPPPGE